LGAGSVTMTLGIQHFDAFLLACIALNLTPGLDTFYILTRSGREGHAVGVAAALGINAGCIVHTLAAVLGISAILMTSALAFSALKYLGAAYLVWIGLRMLFTRGAVRQPTVTRGSGFAAAFRQGMLTNMLNPKVALFFLAFLPQFVSMQAQHPQLSLLVLGLSFIGTGTAWSMVLALLGGHVHRLLDTRPHVGQWMDRVCGTVLLGFGIKLAMQHRK
jgi:threonine/homoserine/homoserine lactone efflux protein